MFRHRFRRAHVLACISLVFALPRAVASSEVPWQSSSGSRTLQELKTYEDLPPTIFSPTGRLHPVERIAKDVASPFTPYSNLVVGLTCKDGIVVISTIPLSPYLNVSTSETPLFLVNETSVGGILTRLGPDIAAVVAGNAVDGQVMGNKVARLFSSLSSTVGGSAVVPAILARRLGDHLQVLTQTTGSKEGRMLSSAVAVVGNRELWRIDPTGQFYDCYAVVIGNGSEQAEIELYKQLRQRIGDGTRDQHFNSVFAELGFDEAVGLALRCIKKAVQESPVNRLPFTMTTTTHWQGLVMDYSQISSTHHAPARKLLRGHLVTSIRTTN